MEDSNSTSGQCSHTLNRNSLSVKRKVMGLRCCSGRYGSKSSGFTVTVTPTLCLNSLHISCESWIWKSSAEGLVLAMRGTLVVRQLRCAGVRGGSSMKLTLKFRGGLRARYFPCIISDYPTSQKKKRGSSGGGNGEGQGKERQEEGKRRRGKLQSMERAVAEKKVSLWVVTCPECKLEQPSYRFLLMSTREIRCYDCATATPQLTTSIHASLKEYYQEIIRKLPVADCRVARECLEEVGRLRVRAGELLEQIRAKLGSFERELEEFLVQAEVTCESYLEKLRALQESRVEEWFRTPPKLIDQQKFVINMRHKHRTAARIADSLRHLQVHIPSIAALAAQPDRPATTPIVSKTALTAALSLRGSLLLGSIDGRLFFERGLEYGSVSAHDSQVRSLAEDGQGRVFSGSDSSIKMWDMRGGEPIALKDFGNLEGVRSYHRQLLPLDGGRALASSRGQFDGYQIRVWDLSSFANTRTMFGHEGYIRSMLLDGRGRVVTVAEDRFLKVWESRTCRLLRAHFHSAKIFFLFAHAPSHAYCIVDERNRVLLLDQDSLSVYHAWSVGRKVTNAGSGSFIYLHVDRYLMIMSWTLDLEERIDLASIWASTSIIEMGSALLLTDVHGNLHQLHPTALAKH